jgi:hypothetical protein
MMVKDNQPALKADLQTLFAHPPGPGQDLRMVQRLDKGHGRIEKRTLFVSTDLATYLDWPGLQQALYLVYTRINTRTGEISTTHRYAITSLSPEQASPARLLQLWRGHWSIENNLHYPLDVWFAEDASRIRTPSTALAMALMRKLVINLIRSLPHYPSLKYAREHFAAQPDRALGLLEIPV